MLRKPNDAIDLGIVAALAVGAYKIGEYSYNLGVSETVKRLIQLSEQYPDKTLQEILYFRREI